MSATLGHLVRAHVALVATAELVRRLEAAVLGTTEALGQVVDHAPDEDTRRLAFEAMRDARAQITAASEQYAAAYHELYGRDDPPSDDSEPA